MRRARQDNGIYIKYLIFILIILVLILHVLLLPQALFSRRLNNTSFFQSENILPVLLETHIHGRDTYSSTTSTKTNPPSITLQKLSDEDGVVQFDSLDCSQGDVSIGWKDVTIFLATSSATYPSR